jgi:hypothetical protein
MSVTEPEEGPAPFEPDVEQAAALRERAAKDGMRFSAYLPPSLAAWVLDEIIAGRFSDPCEAAFCAMQDLQALSEHPPVREALLEKVLKAAVADVQRGDTVSADEMWAGLKKRAAEYEEPPHWHRKSGA